MMQSYVELTHRFSFQQEQLIAVIDVWLLQDGEHFRQLTGVAESDLLPAGPAIPHTDLVAALGTALGTHIPSAWQVSPYQSLTAAYFNHPSGSPLAHITGELILSPSILGRPGVLGGVALVNAPHTT